VFFRESTQIESSFNQRSRSLFPDVRKKKLMNLRRALSMMPKLTRGMSKDARPMTR
jgi:hypothetical protein